MSDFLSRLAARALGTAATVQPRRPSLFEPVNAPPETGDVTGPIEADARPAVPAQRGEPVPGRPMPPDSVRATEGRPAAYAPAPLPPVERAIEAVAPPPPSPAPLAAERVVTVEERREVHSTLRQERTVREEQVTREERLVAGPPPPRRRPGPEEPVGTPASARPPAAVRPRPEPPPTTVEVTIGRVEVRAVHAPPAPSREAPVRRGPSLTLDDYLKQRNRG